MAKTIMRTIGLDLGDHVSHYCIIQLRGKVVERGEVTTTPEGMRRFFARRKGTRIVIEASPHCRWVRELLEELGHEVIVADVRQVALIYGKAKKSDRTDAEMLARLGQSDVSLLNPVTLRSQDAHVDLAVLHARDALVECRTRLVNHVRGVMKAVGCVAPKCETDTFCKRVLPVLPEALRPALTAVIEQIGELTQVIRGYDRQIAELCEKKYPATKRVRQISGVGPLLSLAFVLTIEDPARFKKSRQVPAYFGLVPRRKQSGARDPEMHISKAGNPLIRRLLVQAAQYIMGPFGPASDLQRWGHALADRGGNAARKRAVIAVARKLSVLIHRLWTTGAKYRALGYAG